MEINALGIGEVQLGEPLDSVTDIVPFKMEEDGNTFIVYPSPKVWFKYTGDLSRITTENNGHFSASSLYVLVNAQNCISRIILHPQPPYIEPIEDLLNRVYGPGSYTKGGMGGDRETKNYTHYLYVSRDRQLQISYTKIYNPDFGIDQIIFHFIKDVELLGKANLVYRTWKKPTNSGPMKDQ